jgi:hypothetical protein
MIRKSGRPDRAAREGALLRNGGRGAEAPAVATPERVLAAISIKRNLTTMLEAIAAIATIGTALVQLMIWCYRHFFKKNRYENKTESNVLIGQFAKACIGPAPAPTA